MFCRKCGAKIEINDKFCKNCGAINESINENNEIKPLNQDTFNGNNNSNHEVNNANFNSSNDFNQENVNNNPNNNVNQERVTNTQNSNFGPERINSNPNNNFNSNTGEEFRSNINNMNNMNNNNNQNNYNNNKSTKNLVISIVGIVVILLVIIGGYVGIKFLGNEDGGIAISKNTIYFKNYSLEIPSNMLYENNKDYLKIIDADENWYFLLESVSGSYSIVKNYKSKLDYSFSSSGYNIENSKFNTYGGKELLVYHLFDTVNNKKITGAYTSLDNSNVWAITGYTKNNVYDDKILEKAVKIINSAKTSYVNSIEASDDRFSLASVVGDLEDTETEE